MKVYAVFDTNTLVSAMISRRSDSAVVLALETLLSGEVIPLYNDEILQEYDEVLHRACLSQKLSRVSLHIKDASRAENRTRIQQLYL